MIITKELLEGKGACDDGIEWFADHFPDGGELDALIKSDAIKECPLDLIWWFPENVQQDKELLALCGVSKSRGVNWSNGVSYSFGCLDCHGIDHCLFCLEASGRYLVFNQFVGKERSTRYQEELYPLLDGWRPTFNDISSLYVANGSDWKLAPIKDVKALSAKEAWAGMPEAAIAYIRQLPEFDAEIFEKITGIGGGNCSRKGRYITNAAIAAVEREAVTPCLQ